MQWFAQVSAYFNPILRNVINKVYIIYKHCNKCSTFHDYLGPFSEQSNCPKIDTFKVFSLGMFSELSDFHVYKI